MTLNKELKNFDASCAHLLERIDSVSKSENPSVDDEFIAEAIAFRMFRNQERLIRNFFLDCCVKTRSPAKKPIKSKLRCKDWETAEEILKAGNKFLDWGNANSTRNLANLVFLNGYPINDLITIKQSFLIDLARIRNFVAHDSKEAHAGFSKSARNYLKTGEHVPSTAGKLLLHRRRPTEHIAIRRLFDEIAQLSGIVRAL